MHTALIFGITNHGHQRIKVKLKGLTPLQFRNQSLKSAWLKCPIIGVHFKIVGSLFCCFLELIIRQSS